jgi:hypothetical protein
LLNLGRQEKLHGSWRWIAQRLELAGSDQNGNVVWFKTEPPGGFGGVQASGQRNQIENFFAFGILAFS